MRVTFSQYRFMKTVHDLTVNAMAPPSSRELGAHLGWVSANAVRDMKERLAKKGLLEFEPMKSRCLRLTAEGRRVMELFELTVCSRYTRANCQAATLAEMERRLAEQMGLEPVEANVLAC